jgi:hypothetical protein
MGWALLGLKLVPMIIQAVTSTEDKSLQKGKNKQDEAMQLLQQLLVLSQGTTASPRVSDLVSAAEPETRKLIDALVEFQNATATSAAETQLPRR